MIIRFNPSVIVPAFAALLICAACEGTLNQRMQKISGTIKEIDSAAVNVSKTATKFAKDVESYVDTAAYTKDSTGTWHEKQDVKKKQEKQQGGVFDSIFK